MKKSFLNILATGFMVLGAMAFTMPASTAGPQNKNKKNSRSQADTMSDTRIPRSNYPRVQKRDSLPAPNPVPPTTDTMLIK